MAPTAASSFDFRLLAGNNRTASSISPCVIALKNSAEKQCLGRLCSEPCQYRWRECCEKQFGQDVGIEQDAHRHGDLALRLLDLPA